MSLIVADGLQLSFGPRTILDGDSIRIAEGDRLGLVGANGTGKSTLLKILAGEQNADGGTMTRRKGCRVAYLPQDVMDLGGGAIIDTVLASVPGKSTLEAEIGAVESDLQESDPDSDPDEQMQLAVRLAELHEELAHFETRFSRHAAERILVGLGFQTAELGRPISELSGGWKMRAALAGLLFSAPDVLLLDEPTNHLDLPSVRWLEEFLAGTRHALVLVCHDREFLNAQVNRILSFEMEGLRTYRGNYDSYVRQRAEEEEVLRNSAVNQERERREAQRFIDRFRAQASKARAVQSRIKKLEKLEEVRLLEHRVALRVRLPSVERSAEFPVEIEGLSKRFGDNTLYENVRLFVRRGERVAIVGMNGAGKTTLLKMIGGELTPDTGTIKFGHAVSLAYYAQHHAESLDRRHTICEEIRYLVPSWSETAVRTVLGTFLFSGDDVDKSISVLSGGERARVALAKLLVRPGNLLLMDEPTNHLDTASAEALADALAAFEGTVIFVSHNLSFARRLATKVWDIAGGQVVEYAGSLTDYLQRTETPPSPAERATPAAMPREPAKMAPAKPGKARATAAAPRVAAPPAPLTAPTPQRRTTHRSEERAARRRREALETNARELEARIAVLEADQKKLEADLADEKTYADRARFQQLWTQFQADRAKIDELMARWEQAQQELANPPGGTQASGTQGESS